MRIGVNALYLIPGGVGGTEIYLRNLLTAFAAIDESNQYLVYTNRETDSDLVPGQKNFVNRAQSVRATIRPLRLLWEQTILPFAARRDRLDCLFNPGFTAPVWATCPRVTVFHDLQHKRHPEHFRVFDLPFWRFFLRLSATSASIVLADSEATRGDLERYYQLGPERIRTVHLGVEDEFFRIGDQRSAVEPYVLCVSTLHPHKNIERLIRAFARFRETRPEYSLVLAGMRGFHADAVEAAIRKDNLQGAVRITGWIPRNELYDLYRSASVFVYPSTFEGFGLPVLEAMAAGIPMACSAIEPLQSIVSGSALLFPPEDEKAMAQALVRLMSDDELRKQLTARGRVRAQEFTWERTARLTLDALTTAAGLQAESSNPSLRRDT